ncbi:MAG: hypothetical protein CM15mP49_15460 [Actinomycetota bacterium]|nr:MAG: hypothetical protein CM15mP49_15460 [Actinomycetota bacterium]
MNLIFGVPPGESVNGLENAGIIRFFMELGNGLGDSWGFFHQDTNWVAGIAHADDRFGGGVAVGDRDPDGYDDLVVGFPPESITGQKQVRAQSVALTHGSCRRFINVFYGPLRLKSGDGMTIILVRTRAVSRGIAHARDEFGAAVAVGDIDGDGYDDVVGGSPQEYYWPNARYCARYSCGQVGAINVFVWVCGMV